LFARNAEEVSTRKINFFFGWRKKPEGVAGTGVALGAPGQGPNPLPFSKRERREKSRDELRLTMGFPAARKTLLLFS
jgi:hypothetical protein